MDEYDLVFGSPPYCHAEEFVRLGLGLLAPDGWLCFVLAGSFIHGAGRLTGLFAEYPLRYFCPFAGRIEYEGGRFGPVFSAAYVWQQGYKGPEQVILGVY